DPPGFAAAVEHTDTGATDQVVNLFPHQILADGRPHLTECGTAPVSRVHAGAPQLCKGAGVGFEPTEIELFFGIEAADLGCDASVQDARGRHHLAGVLINYQHVLTVFVEPVGVYAASGGAQI